MVYMVKILSNNTIKNSVKILSIYLADSATFPQIWDNFHEAFGLQGYGTFMATIPDWLKAEVAANKAALRSNPALNTVKDLAENALNTVCVQALCPNRGKCFSEGEATFLLLGEVCTRGCSFCAVKRGKPLWPDSSEPQRVTDTAAAWKLRYVVLTSPTRDDLPDGGAGQYAETISALKKNMPGVKVEPLIPDFGGATEPLLTVLNASPDVLAHNIETVPRLYSAVRSGADYKRSLKLLKTAKTMTDPASFQPQMNTGKHRWMNTGTAKQRRFTQICADDCADLFFSHSRESGNPANNGASFIKSGLMLGMGETGVEILATLADMLEAGCDLLTLGQYLAPSKNHAPVKRYLEPKEFMELGRQARKMGFKGVMSGPLVRSSFQAVRLYQEATAVTAIK